MTDPTTAPVETPPRTHTTSPGNLTHQSVNHRSSFAENLRQSPRSQRHPSFTQAAVQELLNHPPAPKVADPQFAGRDWRQISVGELVQHRDIRFVQLDTGVEEATKLLCESGPPNVVLLRESPSDTSACGTFDFSDLNAYLVVVLGLASPEEDQKEAFAKIQNNAQGGNSIALRDISVLFKRDPLVSLPESADLSKATEIFGSGVHRILICKEGTSEVIGILSQLKLVKFLWDNANSFPIIEQLYPVILHDLGIGTQQTIAINGDKPLTEALQLMSQEGLSSLAVVDNSFNVVGNISTADTRLLTTTSSMPLLKSSCIHFISVILSERGVENGRDSYPVFHVNPFSTLAHTVAKLVATRSHRMWVVEAASPSPSAPLTPSSSHAVLVSKSGSTPASPSLAPTFPVVSASALPGAHISGRLTGVISLTDILNLYARHTGLNPMSPSEQRERRRRSSSSSIRPSIDSARNSSFDLRR